MTGAGSDSPIEAYLDTLVTELSARRPRQLRHLIAEAEAHLRDDAERSMAAGMSAHDAEAQAVARFGPAQVVARAERGRSVVPFAEVVRQVVSSALLLGAVGALAVGLSGLVAGVIGLVGGTRALVDVPAGRVLSGADCTRWLAADPGARSCRDAALSDWAAETVAYRLALGIVGVLVLAAYLLLRHRLGRRDKWAALPPTVSDTIAMTVFGVAGCWTLALGLEAAVRSSGHGSGQWLSAAPVALAAAAVFAWRLVRRLRAVPIGTI